LIKAYYGRILHHIFLLTESLLGDPKIVKHTLEYVEKTERFNFV